MRLKALLADDENAVSPVIGVILMVAITVILAAVIASFVLGLGPGGAAPTVNFDSDFDDTSDRLTVSVTGGDSVPYDQILFSGDNIDGIVNANDNSTLNWPVNEASGSADGETAISAGDDAIVALNSNDYAVDVVWESDDGGTTQTLTTFEG